MHISAKRSLLFLLVLGFFLIGCREKPNLPPSSTESPIPSATMTTTPTWTPTIEETPTPERPSETLTLTSTNSAPIEGCLEPSDDYERVEINGHQLNQRTLEMLQYAARLYSGQIDITGEAITQGSYTNAVQASFGTHAGGGAVDLSVMEHGTYNILFDEIEPLIRALRLAGFAAWYRDFDELYPGSPVHIHAIAIGDRELSMPAREQLAGPHGYFWGYNGLPIDDEEPTRDPHGGPIVCDWMIERGYPNKTATPAPTGETP